MSRAYVEKYLLEKSRLVYQEHNERWEKHVFDFTDVKRCIDPVEIDAQMHKYENRMFCFALIQIAVTL